MKSDWYVTSHVVNPQLNVGDIVEYVVDKNTWVGVIHSVSDQFQRIEIIERLENGKSIQIKITPDCREYKLRRIIRSGGWSIPEPGDFFIKREELKIKVGDVVECYNGAGNTFIVKVEEINEEGAFFTGPGRMIYRGGCVVPDNSFGKRVVDFGFNTLIHIY